MSTGRWIPPGHARGRRCFNCSPDDGRRPALNEAGDLVTAIAAGALKAADILLLRDILADRRGKTRRDITVFKSVRHAAEDLVAVELLLARIHQAAH